jgi:hypothetical protein
MWKLASIIHIMLMSVLMGVLVIAITAVPSLMEQARLLIPVAAAAGFVLALPLSLLVAKRILAATDGR